MSVRWIITALCALVLAGCGVVSTCNDGGGGIRLFGKDVAEQRLKQTLDIGVKEYEEGNYVASMNALQSVLEMKNAGKDDKLVAYKYLAFIHCISSREKLCRDYFRQVLAINPNFELSPAEAGHPIWGPVFRSVKGKAK